MIDARYGNADSQLVRKYFLYGLLPSHASVREGYHLYTDIGHTQKVDFDTLKELFANGEIALLLGGGPSRVDCITLPVQIMFIETVVDEPLVDHLDVLETGRVTVINPSDRSEAVLYHTEDKGVWRPRTN